MKQIIERLLPTGRAYDVMADGRQHVTAVVHDDGIRELHLFARAGHEPTASVRIDDDDARRLGAVLVGTRFRPMVPDALRDRLGELIIDWVRIDASSDAVGRTLAQLELHQRTAMQVIAIVRDARPLVPPPADLPLESGDRVVVVGQMRQLDSVTDLLTG